MARKAKLTVFSRFLIVLVFLAPLAYIGASYYNGEDGIENIKQLVGLSDKSTTKVEPNRQKEQNTNSSSDNADYNTLKRTADQLKKENEQLKQLIGEKEAQILNLKTEIANLKGGN